MQCNWITQEETVSLKMNKTNKIRQVKRYFAAYNLILSYNYIITNIRKQAISINLITNR